MRPNIFDFATKELSQDAFITWLLEFANEKHQSIDQTLNKCGKLFVTQLIQKGIPGFKDPITKIETYRQYKNIDVWAEVNGKYLIIIEDKTYSNQHSNQLARYKETAQKWCESNKYENPICIYLKIGNESQISLDGIEKEGFSIYSRIDFINLLEPFKKTTNNILIDFYERLIRIEKSNNEFENKIIKNWDGNDWQGFFQFLEKKIEIIDWSYVNNPSKGFWNIILSWSHLGGYPVYLQLEEDKLCFKISTLPRDLKDVKFSVDRIERGRLRNQHHDLIMSKAKDLDFKHIRRPKRFGNGDYMTFAIVDQENWLVTTKDQVIDKKQIVNILNNYLEFLETIIKEENSIQQEKDKLKVI